MPGHGGGKGVHAQAPGHRDHPLPQGPRRRNDRTTVLYLTERGARETSHAELGSYTGRARSDAGERVDLDGLTGWVEEVHNRW